MQASLRRILDIAEAAAEGCSDLDRSHQDDAAFVYG
jgi:hypothetical protein